MAQIGNSHQTTANDGLNDYVNIDTILKQLQLVNGALLRIFSDNYTTEVFKAGADAAGTLSWGAGDTTLKRLAAAILGINGALAFGVSATTPDPGANGTIATSTGVSRVTPAAARTGIILAAGTQDGQIVVVMNQGAAANTLTLNTTPATSNVADSATEAAIAGLTARAYMWSAAASLWYQLKGA